MEIQLAGQKRTLKFNQLALEVFTKSTDYSTAQADLYACVYAGLKAAAYVKREEFNLSFEQVCDMCDESDQDELVKAYNEFTETAAFKTWYAKFEELVRVRLSEAEEEKKSQITT